MSMTHKSSAVISCETPQEQIKVIQLLLSFGLKHYKHDTDAYKIHKNTWYSGYKNIYIDYSKEDFCGSSGVTNPNPFSYTEIHKFLDYHFGVNEIMVKLNNEYNAIITKDNVQVGCQTFSHEKILEVAEAIKNINSNSFHIKKEIEMS